MEVVRQFVCWFSLFSLIGEVKADDVATPTFLATAEALVAYAYRTDVKIEPELIMALAEGTQRSAPPYQDTKQTIARRVRNLIGRLDENNAPDDLALRRLYRAYRREEAKLIDAP